MNEFKDCYEELVKQVNELEKENQELKDRIRLQDEELHGFYEELGLLESDIKPSLYELLKWRSERI